MDRSNSPLGCQTSPCSSHTFASPEIMSLEPVATEENTQRDNQESISYQSKTPLRHRCKRKSSLGRKTPAAKRAEYSRKEETPEKTCERLNKAADFIKHERKNQTEEEREERLSKDAEYKAHIRDNERQNKADMEQHKIQFPPIINEDIERRCLADYIEATSNFSLRMSACGICAERCHDFEMIDIWSIPNRELIKQESFEDTIFDEYKVKDLLLHKLGVNEDQTVNCCHKCLSSLNKGKLPPLSLANNFQIGKTPPELSGLTLPEKILISVYRPKMYVTTFRGIAGPGTEQRGLKGNTITFPQDVVKVAHILPSNMNTLADSYLSLRKVLRAKLFCKHQRSENSEIFISATFL